jgi:hypothetical protein
MDQMYATYGGVAATPEEHRALARLAYYNRYVTQYRAAYGAQLFAKFIKYAKISGISSIINALVQTTLELVIAHLSHKVNEAMEDLAEALFGERPDFDN